MTDTANLGLPCIEGSQAQKHVTHNEALRILDTVVQLAVADRDLTAPPGSPAEGARWIVKSGAAGAWAGRDDEIAGWQDGNWVFSEPRTGWLAYVVDEGALLVWSGSAWVDAIAALASLNNMALLGLGTTADTANPLSAKLNNALFVAKTVAEGGDGHLRYKLSKESAANTLSFLFQDNYSGRAEIGLTGDDDFHFKVSADGATWHEGIVIDRSTGAVTFPNTTIAGGREVLNANRIYYVRTDGSDGNTGLANTSGGALQTLQAAFDKILNTLDVAGYAVTVSVADGTYTDGVVISPWVGGGTIIFQGNTTTPANCTVSPTGADCFRVASGGALPGAVYIKGFKLTAVTSGYAINVGGPSAVHIASLNFGSTPSIQMIASVAGAQVTNDGTGAYTISGGSGYHCYASSGGNISVWGVTITLSGTPAFSARFAAAYAAGQLYLAANTFSGSATGTRYLANMNGVIETAGAGASYLPGNAAGSIATGGQYS